MDQLLESPLIARRMTLTHSSRHCGRDTPGGGGGWNSAADRQSRTHCKKMGEYQTMGEQTGTNGLFRWWRANVGHSRNGEQIRRRNICVREALLTSSEELLASRSVS